jgi:hypothetical protein
MASGIGMTILHPPSPPLPSPPSDFRTFFQTFFQKKILNFFRTFAIMQYSAMESFEPFCRTFIRPFFELFLNIFKTFFIFFLNDLLPIPSTPLQQFVNYAQ